MLHHVAPTWMFPGENVDKLNRAWSVHILPSSRSLQPKKTYQWRERDKVLRGLRRFGVQERIAGVWRWRERARFEGIGFWRHLTPEAHVDQSFSSLKIVVFQNTAWRVLTVLFHFHKILTDLHPSSLRRTTRRQQNLQAKVSPLVVLTHTAQLLSGFE